MKLLQKKRASNIKLDKIKFISRINNEHLSRNLNNKIIMNKIKGEDLIFAERKKKAIKIIENINSKLKSDKNLIPIDEIKIGINESLNYDNTNKDTIFEILSILHKYKDKEELENILNKTKFCITKNIEIKNKLISLSKIFTEINPNIIKFNNIDEIIKEFFMILNDLVQAYNEINKLDKEKFNKKEKLKLFFTFGLKKIKENRYIIKTKRKLIKAGKNNKYSDNEINSINIINNYLYNSISSYLFFKEFDYFHYNQKINYRNNSTLYMVNIIYQLYEKLIDNITKTKIQYSESKIEQISKLKVYWEKIEALYSERKIIDEEINDKLELFLFLLDAPYTNINNILTNIMKMEDSLRSSDIQKFIEKNKNVYLENNYICIKYKEKIFKYEYEKYSKDLLKLLNNDSENILENAKWNSICLIDFFEDKDKIYLKKILKAIIKSKFFKEIWNEYSDNNVHEIVDYFFSEEKNIEEFLNSIKFLPFIEKDFGAQAITKNNLLVYTSSLNISLISNNNNYIIYKILEMARKVIILCHEICHYIKRALFIITNGIISQSTKDSIKSDDIFEAGRIFEEIVFNWENEDLKNKKRINTSKKLKKKEKFHEYNSKIIGIDKALKLLNMNFYDKTLQKFKEDFYSDEKINKNDLNEELKEYIKNIGFNLDIYLENEIEYSKYKINCARNEGLGYNIFYESDNHSRFNDKHLIRLDNLESDEDENEEDEYNESSESNISEDNLENYKIKKK